MKIRNSLKTAKARHKDCRLVRRKGRIYIINKTNPRFKARQGWNHGLAGRRAPAPLRSARRA